MNLLGAFSGSPRNPMLNENVIYEPIDCMYRKMARKKYRPLTNFSCSVQWGRPPWSSPALKHPLCSKALEERF